MNMRYLFREAERVKELEGPSVLPLIVGNEPEDKVNNNQSYAEKFNLKHYIKILGNFLWW